MATPFHVYGPFEFRRTHLPERWFQNERWAEIEDEFPGLPAGQGVYLLSLKNGSNYQPFYVGMTKSQGFRREVFNKSNCLKVAHDLKNIKGRLCIHLLAKPNASRRSFKKSIPKKALNWLEVSMIFSCLGRKCELLNRQNVKFLQSVEIDQVTGPNRPGMPSKTVRTFKKAIGW